MGFYQVCANKSPWVKLALQRLGGVGGAYIQVSDLRAIMALLLYFFYLQEARAHRFYFNSNVT
jgi:hypothetical protein